jgi:hypothetical protein
MALTTYTELKAAIADYAHRSDLTTQIVDCVTLAEARLYDLLVLKDMESDESLTLTIGQNYVALPTGYIAPRAFWLVIDSERVPLDAVTPERLPYYSTNAQPRLWAIDGANVRFDCPADVGYSAKLRCLKKSNLGASVASNALLAARPDIYLSGSMVELARWTGDETMFNTWEPVFLRGIAAFKASQSRNRGVAKLRTDIPTVYGTSRILRGE